MSAIGAALDRRRSHRSATLRSARSACRLRARAIARRGSPGSSAERGPHEHIAVAPTRRRERPGGSTTGLVAAEAAARTRRRARSAPPQRRLRTRRAASDAHLPARPARLARRASEGRAARSVPLRRAVGIRAAGQPAGPRPGRGACGSRPAARLRCHLLRQRVAVSRGRSPRSRRTTCRSGAHADRARRGRRARSGGRRATRRAPPIGSPVRRRASGAPCRAIRLGVGRSRQHRPLRRSEPSGCGQEAAPASRAARRRLRPSAPRTTRAPRPGRR